MKRRTSLQVTLDRIKPLDLHDLLNMLEHIEEVIESKYSSHQIACTKISRKLEKSMFTNKKTGEYIGIEGII